MRGACGAVLAVWLVVGACSEAVAQPPTSAGANETRYRSPQHRWSIVYPSAWTLTEGNPGAVRIKMPSDEGQCFVNAGPMPFKSTDEFTDLMLRGMSEGAKRQGWTLVVRAQQPITLPSGLTGNDVLTELQSQIRTRQLHFLAGGRGYEVVCEVRVNDWDRLAPTLDRVLRSFSVER